MISLLVGQDVKMRLYNFLSNSRNEWPLAQGVSLALFNWKGWILAAVLWVLTNKVKKTKGLHPIVFILASAVVGVAFSM